MGHQAYRTRGPTCAQAQRTDRLKPGELQACASVLRGDPGALAQGNGLYKGIPLPHAASRLWPLAPGALPTGSRCSVSAHGRNACSCPCSAGVSAASPTPWQQGAALRTSRDPTQPWGIDQGVFTDLRCDLGWLLGWPSLSGSRDRRVRW